MPEDPKYKRVFCDYNIYNRDTSKTHFWHWSNTAEGLLCAHDEDSVNILVKYDPNQDPNYGT